jgi:ATP-dependent helicase/nuclease subunit B
VTVTPLVTLLFSGPSLTEHDDLPAGSAHLGRPVWTASQLLANLELRLGLPRAPSAQAVRVQHWSRRMTDLEAEHPGQFYARSHRMDAIGTAETLLGWRDELVMAGWNGDVIPEGGARIETLRELNAIPDLPLGKPERLRELVHHLHVLYTRDLRGALVPLFDTLLLAEARTLWPGRWEQVFTFLELLGTPIRTTPATFEPIPGDSDLAHLQALLREETPSSTAAASHRLQGDGSLILLRAETSRELADATAALLSAWHEPSTAIIRSGEKRPFDDALVAHGLASQGLDSTSEWRPALQVLPLAVELAFEPRDPYRVLELLTLPVGPFQGLVGGKLASALAEAPGIGGPAWQDAKKKIAELTRAKILRESASSGVALDAAEGLADERVEAQRETIATWLELPGLEATKPAPRASLLTVADRVQTWLRKRLAVVKKSAQADPTNPALAEHADILGTAFARAQEFHATLSHESRAGLDLVDARLLLEQVSSGHTLVLSTEAAGRIDPVDSPAALRRARDVVVWWHCVGGTEWRPSVRPWRKNELAALSAAGLLLPHPEERLAAEAQSWHHAIHAARKRLVLAIPRWALGEALEPHPVWHEIAARFGAKSADLARITVDAHDLLAGRVHALGHAAPPVVRDLGPLALPAARPEWRLDPAYLGAAVRHSATSLDALVGCPLQWVFKYPAHIQPGALDSISSGPQLCGKLGHRLVEELHGAGVLANPGALGEVVASSLDRLLREEAAVFLLPGATFELSQLRDQLGRAVTSLAEMLTESKLTVAGVEVVVEAPWRAGVLGGRLDLLLRDEAGRDVVLDLKWGLSRYRDLLQSGGATQLAVYAAARMQATKAKAMPAAAYFSLKRGQLLATPGGPFRSRSTPIDGPDLAETWARFERTADRVEKTLLTGRVPVTGVRGGKPLLEGMGLSASDQDRHLAPEKDAACTYCPYDALCGRKWQELA